jgi:hypothetical protein
MKSRELCTIHNVIITDYTIEDIGNAKFRHSFHPQNTDTVYEFIANGTPELIEGERYNIGYKKEPDGRKYVDISCISKNTKVNPIVSYYCAKQASSDKHAVNKEKNDVRVTYEASDDYYWGKKYAWREFGLAIPKNAFFQYLDEINHKKTHCIITNPDDLAQTTSTVAYAEAGLDEAIFKLLTLAEKASPAYFKSPLFSKRFSIRGVDAITDKK